MVGFGGWVGVCASQVDRRGPNMRLLAVYRGEGADLILVSRVREELMCRLEGWRDVADDLAGLKAAVGRA